MKTDRILNVFVLCALCGLFVSAPVDGLAQTRKKSTTVKTSAKAKKPVQRKATKVKAPTTGVVRSGAFRPLKSDSRMTVISPGKPATPADLTAAKSRKTVLTQRTISASPKSFGTITSSNFGNIAVSVSSPNTRWWGYGGPPTSSRFDPRYGWITTVGYPWGNVMYTYGYQVVNYWDGNGYVWIAYSGVPGVAYPVLYR